MSIENVAIVRRFYEEVFNKGNLDGADEFLATDAVGHETLFLQGSGLEGFKQSVASLRAAFPDLYVTLEDVISVGDKVVVRWMDRGTHQGEFLGMAPTGKRVKTTGITIFHMAGGRIVEQWTNWDTLNLMAQLGVRELQLSDLVGRLLASQEEERRRVAYEVHDGLTQTALVAYRLLENYAINHPPETAGGAKDLNQTLELVQQIMVEARGVIRRLRPRVLDDFGLSAAIHSQVEALGEEGWDIIYDDALGDERLADAVEIALFRVAQEALTNVRKHAQSTRVRITLRRTERDVRLRVRDWGRGLQTTEPPNRGATGEQIGLYGMRERISLLGGEFEIRGKPNVGTLLIAKVPLPEPGEG